MALERAAREALPAGTDDLPIHDVLKYHLGRVDAEFRPERADGGKRIRPKLCVIICQALDGDVDCALPVAAAIELIHNFTLLHDDIQDRSELRRHRRTVRSIWGDAQALNAGDAMFVVAHLALNQTVELGLPAERAIMISNALHRTTLRIVEGQVLDLSFEARDSVTQDEYLRMISGKSAAIISFACEAGAMVAGADAETTAKVAAFGQALGIGFQIHDDVLGVWGSTTVTGKPQADDIRRRKKALPLLLLLERAQPVDRAHLQNLLAYQPLPDSAVNEILELMTHYEVRSSLEAQVERWHDQARDQLEDLNLEGPAADRLRELVERLATRVA